MTALAVKPDLKHFDRWFARNEPAKDEGLDHLLAAAQATGVKALHCAEHTGWNNMRGAVSVRRRMIRSTQIPSRRRPRPSGPSSISNVRCSRAPLTGIGASLWQSLWAWGLGRNDKARAQADVPYSWRGAGVWSWCHVDDAAAATVRAVEHGARGIYNIVDDEPARVSNGYPILRKRVGAKPPFRMPVWLGAAGRGCRAQWMTEGRGASNAKASASLDCSRPGPTWREGFRRGLFGQEQVDRRA